VIIPPMNLATVMDSLRKSPDEYKSMRLVTKVNPMIICLNQYYFGMNHAITIHSFSTMRSVWEKLRENHAGHYTGELKWKMDFPVRTRC